MSSRLSVVVVTECIKVRIDHFMEEHGFKSDADYSDAIEFLLGYYERNSKTENKKKIAEWHKNQMKLIMVPGARELIHKEYTLPRILEKYQDEIKKTF